MVLRSLARGLAALAFATAAGAASTIDLRSDAGDPIGLGQAVHLDSNVGLLVAEPLDNDWARGTRVTYSDNASNWTLVFATVPGQPSNPQRLAPGNYENAHRAGFTSPLRPGLNVSTGSRSCSKLYGRYTVREAEYAPNGSLTRLAIDFIQHCEGLAPALTGYVRINSTVLPFAELPVAAAGAGFQLGAGELATLDGRNSYDVLSSIRTYGWRQVSGPAASLVGVTSPQVQFVAPAVPPGGADLVFELQVTNTFNIPATDRVTVHVRHPNDPRRLLYVFSGPLEGIFNGGQYVFDENTVAFEPKAIGGTTADNVAVTIAADDTTGFAWFGSPLPASLAAQLYTDAQLTPLRPAGVPGIDISWDGRACSLATGRFRILELAYAPDGTVTRFAADFVQRCPTGTAQAGVVIGSVRYDSTLPVRPGDIDNDGIPDRLEDQLGRDPVSADNDVYNNTPLFVMQQYRDFLGREADADGLAYWSAQINNGVQTRAQVVRGFLESAEFSGRVSPVIRLYFAALGRVPDYDGLLYWVNVLAGGAPRAGVVQSFTNSPEFMNGFGQLDDAAFVTSVYQRLLGRAPDPDGYDYWFGRLSTLQISRAQMLDQFALAQEFIAASTNDVVAVMLYVGLLRRSPEPAGFASWLAALDGGTSVESVIGSFIFTPEYQARFVR